MQEVVGRPRRRARADAEAAGRVGLRIEVDHEHGRARLRETGGDVDRGRRLADAALLVRHCVDPRHRPDPTAAVGRIRARAAGASRPSRAGAESAPAWPRACRSTSTPGTPATSTCARQRAPPRTRDSSPAGSRDHSTRRPPGRQQRQAQLGRDRRRSQRARDHAGAGVAQRAARRRPRSARRARCTPTPSSRPPSAMNAALRAVASIRCTSRCGPHDSEHEPGQATAAADVRQRAGWRGVDRRQAAQRVQHVARGSLGRVADRGHADGRGAHALHEQREARRAAAASAGAPSAMTAARDADAVSRETRGRCVT